MSDMLEDMAAFVIVAGIVIAALVVSAIIAGAFIAVVIAAAEQTLDYLNVAL